MKYKAFVLPLLLMICLIFALKNPGEICFYTKNALDLCFGRLIPSLYIFVVLTRLLTSAFCSFSLSSIFSQRAAHRLYISQRLLPMCLVGLFCGVPTSAIGICDIYKKGLCSKVQAENACILSSFCSASFIFGFASGMFTDKNTAIIIYISNVLSTITAYFLLCKRKKELSCLHEIQDIREPFGAVLTRAVSTSFFDMINICSYVVFFYVLSSVITSKTAVVLIRPGIEDNTVGIIKAFVCSVFEMTSGVIYSGGISGYYRVLMVSFGVSFMGLSIIFQVKNILSSHGLSYNGFLKARLISAFLCPLYTSILLLIIPIDRPVFANNSSIYQNSDGVKTIIILLLFTFISFKAVEVLKFMDKKHKKQLQKKL